MLKKENDFLHSASSLSRQTSHSISPTPASFSSEKSAQADFLFNLHTVRFFASISHSLSNTLGTEYVCFTPHSLIFPTLFSRRGTDHVPVAANAQVRSVVLQTLIKIDKDFPVCSTHPPAVMVTNRPIGDSFLCAGNVPVQRVAMVSLIIQRLSMNYF